MSITLKVSRDEVDIPATSDFVQSFNQLLPVVQRNVISDIRFRNIKNQNFFLGSYREVMFFA